MNREDDYRTKAAASLHRALHATSMADKIRLLGMAEAWLELARPRPQSCRTTNTGHGGSPPYSVSKSVIRSNRCCFDTLRCSYCHDLSTEGRRVKTLARSRYSAKPSGRERLGRNGRLSSIGSDVSRLAKISQCSIQSAHFSTWPSGLHGMTGTDDVEFFG
jgi:hypothetical protein